MTIPRSDDLTNAVLLANAESLPFIGTGDLHFGWVALAFVVLAFGFSGPIVGFLVTFLCLLIWAITWIALRKDRKVKHQMALAAKLYNKEFSQQHQGIKPKNQILLNELHRATVGMFPDWWVY